MKYRFCQFALIGAAMCVAAAAQAQTAAPHPNARCLRSRYAKILPGSKG